MRQSLVSVFTLIAFFLQTVPAFAIDLESSFSGPSAGQSEYFNSNRDKRMLIQVNILSGVTKPGIHQIPDNTNMLDALALAGGLTAESDFEKVFIKRRSPGGKKFETIEVNVSELMQNNKAVIPALQNYDTVLVEQRPHNEQKLLTTLAVVASLVSIVSGVILIKKLN